MFHNNSLRVTIISAQISSSHNLITSNSSQDLITNREILEIFQKKNEKEVGQTTVQIPCMIGWIQPKQEWCKLNTDGCMLIHLVLLKPKQ